MSARILVADPVKHRRKLLCEMLGVKHTVVSVSDGAPILGLLERSRFDLLILAVRSPDKVNWEEELKPFKRKDNPLGIIVVAENNEQAIDAVKKGGANGCLPSSFSIDVLNREVDEVLRKLLPKSSVELGLPGMVGVSPEMQNLFREIETVASGDSPVLIIGEPGAGKTTAAKVIHQLSNRGRAERPFRICRCAGLDSQALEVELFGYERGVFSWASEPRPGLVEEAGGGTVYLDEVAELDGRMQTRILRLLEEPTQQAHRMGGSSKFSVDVRLLGGSTQALRQRVEQRLFRQDLFFRMSQIELPPLKRRREDIPELVQYFLRRLEFTSHTEAAAGASRPEATSPRMEISDEVMAVLSEYHWPGNVRELKNTMEQAARRQNSRIELKDLPVHIRTAALRWER